MRRITARRGVRRVHRQTDRQTQTLYIVVIIVIMTHTDMPCNHRVCGHVVDKNKNKARLAIASVRGNTPPRCGPSRA